MRRFFTLLTVLMFSGILASAQTRTISGQVRDVQGNPVAFASVTEKGTTNAVTTDATGNFSIKVKQAAATLVATAVGYDKQEVNATGNSVTLALTRNTQELTAVVVTGLAQVRQKSSLGYATATVKSKELTQASPVNLQNGLTAKVSGLNVATTNSGVFGSTRITLRGIRSLTGNNQPMLVLDGVSISLGFLNSINPNDVADVSVLKSASATAIYGPEGVNGAIIITTKRGSKQRPMVSFSQATQWEKIAYMPKFQDRFGSGYNQDPNTGLGEFEPIEQQSWGPAFDGSIRQFGQTGPNGEKLILPYSYVPNGRKNFFTTGVTSQTDASFSTGDFYISGQKAVIKSTLPGDRNHRNTITLRAEKEYNKFKAIFNAHYTNQNYDVTTANQLIYYDVTGAPGQYDLSRFKNWREDYFSSPDGYYTPYLVNFQRTPYMAKDINRQRGRTNDLFGDLELNYKLTNWLNFVYRLGGSVSDTRAKTTREPFTPSAYHLTLRDASATAISATVSDANNFSSRLLSEIFANINTKYKKLGVALTLGQSYRETYTNDNTISSSNLGQSQFLSIQTRIGEPGVAVGSSKAILERYFGRLSLDYNGMVYVEATGSYDRDSRLVPNDKQFTESNFAFFYPGVNTSILLHKIIPGLETNKIWNYFKLRGAISKTGNVNLPVYAAGTFGIATFFPFGSTLGYTVPTSNYQRLYRPEFVINKEVGVELGFLKNRINVEANYYTQDNSNQVLDLALSNTTGVTTSKLNAAEFTNKGLELDLKLTPLVKIGQLNVDVKLNYTHQTSKVTKLVDGVNTLGIGNYNYLVVGKSANVFRLTDYKRDTITGKVIVDAATGMPEVNPNLTTFGKTTPDNIFGVSVNFNFKGLTLGIVAEYRGGNQIVADQLGQYMDDNGISARSAQYGRRAFIWPNSVIMVGGKAVPNTSVYTSIYNREFWNSELNTDAISNYVADGSFWKLREVSLSYEFPARIFKSSTFVRGVTIGLTGRNLLTWLPKSNQWTDPEFSSNGNSAYTGNAQGRSTAFNLPPTRLFGANISVQF